MNKFLKEIEEQPFALKNTLDYYTQGDGSQSLKQAYDLLKKGKFSNILFTGMGSSYFISYAGSCFLNANNIKSSYMNAGELLHYHSSLLEPETLLICISQSGESYEIVKILETLPANVTVIAICNEPESSLARKASCTLLSMAGKEEMTSSKTYVSTYLVTYLLSLNLSQQLNEKELSYINKSIDIVTETLKKRNEWLKNAVNMIGHVPFVQLTGRGPVFSSVQQSALMIMEASRNPASALMGGEFRHGPMEMIREGSRVIIFAPLGKTYNQNIAATKDVLKFGAQVLLITDKDPEISSDNLFTIALPPVNEALFSITGIIPMQLIVNQWSLDEKNKPGDFVRGAKVTTRE